MTRPRFRVLHGGGTDPADTTNDAGRLAIRVMNTLAQCVHVWHVHGDGSITVTFDKRAALAVRALITWRPR